MTAHALPLLCVAAASLVAASGAASAGGARTLPADALVGCCCPAEGCYVEPRFNWILSACQGAQCGAPAVNVAHKQRGTRLVVNYVAAYQFDASTGFWALDAPSSFNTDGSRAAYDAIQPDGGNLTRPWMQPQPGGASAWAWGYYPAGVRGVGAPGMLFVLSTEAAWNMAWYMLNQATLDRGPAVAYPAERCPGGRNSNCWAAGNAGEIDFLESPWTVAAGAADGYRRLFATQWNQIGRSFPGQMGATCNADGGWFSDAEATTNYFLGSDPDSAAPDPVVWAAVVDRVGTFIYRIPAAEAPSVWPGLARTTAACTLQRRPSVRPPNAGPPCRGSGYCALFLPNCQASAWGAAAAGVDGGANAGCKINTDQGWCGNWWLRFADTQQWRWPAGGTRSVLQRQAPAPAHRMPWNREMEAAKVDWADTLRANAGCCVNGTGSCPVSAEPAPNDSFPDEAPEPVPGQASAEASASAAAPSSHHGGDASAASKASQRSRSRGDDGSELGGAGALAAAGLATAALLCWL
eukprot:m51a1_g7100 hypothetical protein (522) ;mRNA; r:49131-51303